MDFNIKHIPADNEGEFEVQLEGERSGNLFYTMKEESKMFIQHTEVSDKLKGSGASVKLLELAADYARSNNLKIVPVCSFARVYMAERHRDKFQDVLA